MTHYIVIFGALINLFGSTPYILATIRGKVKPNRVSWMMWSVAPLIGTAAALSSGVEWAVLPVFMAGFCPLLTFLASFWNKKAYWKLSKFDYLCGACSALALVLWWITGDPLIAIIFAVISDGFAALPTLIKSWKYPETEAASTYVAGLLNALTSFFALQTFEASEIIFPIYLVMMTSMLTLFIIRKRIMKSLL